MNVDNKLYNFVFIQIVLTIISAGLKLKSEALLSSGPILSLNSLLLSSFSI